MTRKGRLRLLLFIVLVAVPAMLVGTLAWYVWSGRLRGRVEREWTERFPGTLTVEDVSLAGVSRVELAGLTLVDGERTVATVRRVGLWGPPLSSLTRRTEVEGLELWAGPDSWDFLARLGSAMGEQEGAPESELVLRDATVHVTARPLVIDELSVQSRGEASEGVLRCTWDGRETVITFAVDASKPHATTCTAAGVALPVPELRELLTLVGVVPPGLPAVLPRWLTVKDLAIGPREDGSLGIAFELHLEPAFYGLASLAFVDGRLGEETVTGRLMLRLDDREEGPFTATDPGLACRYDLLTGEAVVTPVGRWPCLPLVRRFLPVLGVELPAWAAPFLGLVVPSALDPTGTELTITADGRLGGPVRIAWPVGAIAADVALAGGRLTAADLAVRVDNVVDFHGRVEAGLAAAGPAVLAWDRLDLRLLPIPHGRELLAALEILGPVLPRGEVRWADLADPAGVEVDLRGADGHRLDLRRPDGGLAVTGAGLPMSLLSVAKVPFVIHAGTMTELVATWLPGEDGSLAMQEARTRLADVDIDYHGWRVRGEGFATRYLPGEERSRTTITLPGGEGGSLVFTIPRDRPHLDLEVNALHPEIWSRTVSLSHPQAQVLADEVSGLTGAVTVTAHFEQLPQGGILTEDLAVTVADLERPLLAKGLEATWLGRLAIDAQGLVDLTGAGILTGGTLGAGPLRYPLAKDRPLLELSIATTAEFVEIRRVRLAARVAGELPVADPEDWYADLRGTIDRADGSLDCEIFADRVDLAWFKDRFPDFPLPPGVALEGVASLLYDLVGTPGAWRLQEGHLVFAAADLEVPGAALVIEGLQGSLVLPTIALNESGATVVPPPAEDPVPEEADDD